LFSTQVEARSPSLRKGSAGTGMQKVKVKVKDSKSVVESAERESKREFVVLTPCAYSLVVSDDPCVVC
jgi:hypothetical protein